MGGFFTAQTQKIEESTRALDVLEDIPNVGAVREERIDGFNQFALIDENTPPDVYPGTIAGGPVD